MVFIQKFVAQTLGFLNSIKSLHWSTSSHSVHMALDQLFGIIQTQLDQFVETYAGGFQRAGFPLLRLNTAVHLRSTDVADIEKYLGSHATYYNKVKTRLANSALENIVDEFCNAISQCRYRLTLR